METKYYEEMDDLFDQLSLGDELVILRHIQSNQKGRNYGRVKSIKATGVKVTLKDGKDYIIDFNSFDETNKKLSIKNAKTGRITVLGSVIELYAIVKDRDDETGKITKILGKYNPVKNHERRYEQQQAEQKEREEYEEYLSIMNSDDKYTDLQKEKLKANLDEMKAVIDDLEDGDILYIYQAPMMDYPAALKDYWEDWINQHGDDDESIRNGAKETPSLNDMYDQNNVNRISFTVEVDDSGMIYVKKPIDKTNKLDQIEHYIKSGHLFKSDNLVFDENDINRNVGLYGQYSLEIDSIFDMKKGKDGEYDPDENDEGENNGSSEMSDAEIMKMIANDKEVASFLSRKPDFWDFIKSGGKKRRGKPFTQSHFRLMQNAIHGVEQSDNRKKKFHDVIIDSVGSSILGNNNEEILANSQLLAKGYTSNGKSIVYLYDEQKKFIGKIFSKDTDLYDSNTDEFIATDIDGELKTKNGKTPIKITVK